MLLRIVRREGAPLDTPYHISETDYMDNGTPITLNLTINPIDRTAIFDFEGTGVEVLGNFNTPKSVVKSAIIYCLRALVDSVIPLNAGCLRPITILLPENSLVNPSPTAGIVGGNVLTSQRITDVVLKAFKAAADSQGCMNNFTFGNNSFGYYETIAGGAGAGPTWNGASGVHTHMTNTRITDPEIFESRFPVILRKFTLRQGTGGKGAFRGGDGVERAYQFKQQLEISILSERRVLRPRGIQGGEDASTGLNLYIFKDGRTVNVGGKSSFTAEAGSKFIILTPGGGGYGKPNTEIKSLYGDKKEANVRIVGSLDTFKKLQEQG